MCPSGYTGKNCESKYIPCSPSPCQNGGTCKTSTGLTYECKCREGKSRIFLRKTIIFLHSGFTQLHTTTHIAMYCCRRPTFPLFSINYTQAQGIHDNWMKIIDIKEANEWNEEFPAIFRNHSISHKNLSLEDNNNLVRTAIARVMMTGWARGWCREATTTAIKSK